VKRGLRRIEVPAVAKHQPRVPMAGAAAESDERMPVTARLQALQTIPYDELRREWRRLYRAEAPRRVSRDLLELAVGWKIQEQTYGGLDAVTKRQLAALAATLERDGDIRRSRVTRLKPGAKMIREWHGETHTVIVREDGFEWKGRSWRSLSAIAREITGVHWSGPRFFGTSGKTGARAEPADD